MGDDHDAALERDRLRLEEMRFELDRSFARKWWPTMATLMAGLIGAMFSYAQFRAKALDDRVMRDDAKVKDEREWGIKVVEMYFKNRDFFDLTKNSEAATSNLHVLAVVAPNAVQGVLNAEISRIPPPSS